MTELVPDKTWTKLMFLFSKKSVFNPADSATLLPD